MNRSRWRISGARSTASVNASASPSSPRARATRASTTRVVFSKVPSSSSRARSMHCEHMKAAVSASPNASETLANRTRARASAPRNRSAPTWTSDSPNHVAASSSRPRNSRTVPPCKQCVEQRPSLARATEARNRVGDQRLRLLDSTGRQRCHRREVAGTSRPRTARPCQPPAASPRPDGSAMADVSPAMTCARISCTSARAWSTSSPASRPHACCSRAATIATSTSASVTSAKCPSQPRLTPRATGSRLGRASTASSRRRAAHHAPRTYQYQPSAAVSATAASCSPAASHQSRALVRSSSRAASTSMATSWSPLRSDGPRAAAMSTRRSACARRASSTRPERVEPLGGVVPNSDQQPERSPVGGDQ